jgi:hypothetical protein
MAPKTGMKRVARCPPMFDPLASLTAFQLLGLDPGSHLGEAVHFFVMDAPKIFVLLTRSWRCILLRGY